ncbi:MAG: phosphoserine phosphatase [Euryarchaeota archaeon]|nr:phosphoserine phosphatase [Euryarchaeota archaeon]
MVDAIEELERKRAECNTRADEHRAKRDRLNAEAHQWADRRAATVDELRAKSAEAQDHRRMRDQLNEGVREAKRAREEANRRADMLAEKVSELKRTRVAHSNGPPVWRLKKELKELEFRHMTSSLTKDAEVRLIADMQRLQREIKAQDDQLRKDPEVEGAIKEAEPAREEAETCHRAVEELAVNAQKEHEGMVRLFEEVDKLRREADEIHQKLVEVKTASDEEHKAAMTTIEEVRDLEKMLYAAKTKSGLVPAPMEAPKEEDLFARFKKGGKISTEDLMALQKSAR